MYFPRRIITSKTYEIEEVIKDTRSVNLGFRYQAKRTPHAMNEIAIRYVSSIKGRCLKISDGANTGNKVSTITTTGILIIIKILFANVVPTLSITKDMTAIPDSMNVGTKTKYSYLRKFNNTKLFRIKV